MAAAGEKIKNSSQKSIYRRISRAFIDYWWHIRLFSPNVRLFLLGTFLVALTTAGGQLLFNLYLKERGADESFIGTFLSAGALGTSIVAIPAAFVLRRIKLKMVLLFSTAAYTLTVLFISRLSVGDMLILISLISGLAFSKSAMTAL